MFIKKIIAVLAIVPIVIALVSCGYKDAPQTTTTPLGEAMQTGAYPQTIYESDHCVVLDTGSEADGNYLYRILDHNGKIVKEQKTFHQPQVISLTDTIFGVCVSFGTGASAAKTFYYNTENGEMSKDFPCVLAQTTSFVVCGEQDRLIISSIFDGALYYEIDAFQYPPAMISDIPFQTAELSDDESSITVTYLTGEYNWEKGLFPYQVTETIQLNKT